jgi:hypothetical protein
MVCADEPDNDNIPEPEIVPLFVRSPWTVSVLDVAIKTVSPEATKKSSWAMAWKKLLINSGIKIKFFFIVYSLFSREIMLEALIIK